MRMNKLAIALAAIGLSASAYAGGPVMGQMGPANADSPPVTAPYASGFEVGVDFMWLRPHLTDTDYGVSVTEHNSSAHFNICCIDHDCYDFGKRVTLGYHFANTANDIQLVVMWYSGDDDDCCTGVEPNFGSFADRIKADSEICDYWHADLRLGQWVNVCPSLGLHLFAGVRYADIEHDVKYRIYNSSNDLVESAREKSDFSGIGPQFGADFNYDLGAGFGLIGNVTASVLYSKDQDSRFCVNITNQESSADLYWKGCDNDYLVPVIDMSLGVHYTYNFDDATSLDVALAYQTVYYHEVFDRSATRVAFNGNIKGSDNAASFGLSGPYLGLKLYLA